MQSTANAPQRPARQHRSLTIHSPVSGTLLADKAVSEPFFTSGLWGKGVAIQLTSGQIVAPLSGTLERAPEVGYELLFKATNGLRMMVKIGTGTEGLMGERWQRLTKPGEPVTAGTPLASFDLLWLRRQQTDSLAFVTIVNHHKLASLTVTPSPRVRALEDPLFTLTV